MFKTTKLFPPLLLRARDFENVFLTPCRFPPRSYFMVKHHHNFSELPVLRTPPTSCAKHPQGPPLGQVKLSPSLSDPKVKYFLLSDSACTLFIAMAHLTGSMGMGATATGGSWPGPVCRGAWSPEEQGAQATVHGLAQGPKRVDYGHSESPRGPRGPQEPSGCDAGGGQAAKAALYLSTTKVCLRGTPPLLPPAARL